VSFGLFSAPTVAGIVGALTLLFLAQRMFFPPQPDAPPPPRWVGVLMGTAAGYTSFVAHCRRAAGDRLRAAACGWRR
jgi:hypothetical protein